MGVYQYMNVHVFEAAISQSARTIRFWHVNLIFDACPPPFGI